MKSIFTFRQRGDHEFDGFSIPKHRRRNSPAQIDIKTDELP